MFSCREAMRLPKNQAWCPHIVGKHWRRQAIQGASKTAHRAVRAVSRCQNAIAWET
jgi:hypothetical protein